MPNHKIRLCFALVGVATVAGIFPAAAKIKCSDDGFQVVQGNLLSTPYCQDALLGKVARQYGMRAADAAIRNNPNFKQEVCRLVGHDIRVQQACLETGYRRRGY